jgi:hypothetical protein
MGAIHFKWVTQPASLFVREGAIHAPVHAPPARGRIVMNSSRLLHYINDPRGPEEVLPTLPAEELAKLLDALFQNLDTPEPEYGAQAWYEMAVEESTRRSNPVGSNSSEGAAHGVA